MNPWDAIAQAATRLDHLQAREVHIRCGQCKAYLPPASFYANASRPHGKHWRCIDCAKAKPQKARARKQCTEYTRSYYLANRQAVIDRATAYYRTNAERIKAQARERYRRARRELRDNLTALRTVIAPNEESQCSE